MRPRSTRRASERQRGSAGEAAAAAPLLPGFPVQIANRYNVMCLSRVEEEEEESRGPEHNGDGGWRGAERDRGEGGEDVLYIKREKKTAPGANDVLEGGEVLASRIYLATEAQLSYT